MITFYDNNIQTVRRLHFGIYRADNNIGQRGPILIITDLNGSLLSINSHIIRYIVNKQE